MAFGLQLTVVGMLIVYLVLGLIAGIIGLISRVDHRWQREEERARAESLDAEPTIDNLTAVVIASAVAAIIGGRSRIRSVRRLLPADAASSAWSAQGRAVLQGSHVISRRAMGTE